MSNARSLIESVVGGESPKNALSEVAVSTSDGRTKYTPDQVSEYKKIVQAHFRLMTEALETAGCKFNAQVNDGYASVDF